MTCVICKTGHTEPGLSNTVFDHEGRIIVVKDVPAEVCQQCGEAYFNSKISAQVYEQVMLAMDNTNEVEIIHLKAA